MNEALYRSFSLPTSMFSHYERSALKRENYQRQKREKPGQQVRRFAKEVRVLKIFAPRLLIIFVELL